MTTASTTWLVLATGLLAAFFSLRYDITAFRLCLSGWCQNGCRQFNGMPSVDEEKSTKHGKKRKSPA